MKALKPSHREKKRYLLLFGKDAIEREIDLAILKFLGIFGYSKICPQIVKMQKPKNGLVLAINHSELNKVRAAFLLSGKDICIKKVSGILNKL